MIIIHNFHPKRALPFRYGEIENLIKKVFRKEKKKIKEINLNFVSDGKIRLINQKYLKHNYSTDIITFDYSGASKSMEAEMIISLDRVKENTRIFRTSYARELRRVIIHGCLHLAGYNDRTNIEKELIRFKENSYLGN